MNEDDNKLTDGIALCLSGGGYRAMVFHLGALIRLNEARLLGRLDRVSSVSGGSIAATCLGQNWNELGFGADGRAANLGLGVRVLPWVEGERWRSAGGAISMTGAAGMGW